MSTYAMWSSMNRNSTTDNAETGPSTTDREFLRYATLGGATPGMADAMGTLALFSYLSGLKLSPFKSLERALAHLGRSVRTALRGKSEAGEAAEMIPVEHLEEIFREVRRHQWLEAEKAGKNIWAEHNPHDPDAVAFRDWVAKHYGSWRDSRPDMITAR